MIFTQVKINFNLKSLAKKGFDTEKIIDEVSGYAENRIALNAYNNVYSYIPKTKNYRRTGRLLGGRSSTLTSLSVFKRKLNKTKVIIEADPRLKGAKENYAPHVEFGTKRIKERPFFRPSIEETNKKSEKIMKNIIDNQLKNI